MAYHKQESPGSWWSPVRHSWTASKPTWFAASPAKTDWPPQLLKGLVNLGGGGELVVWCVVEHSLGSRLGHQTLPWAMVRTGLFLLLVVFLAQCGESHAWARGQGLPGVCHSVGPWCDVLLYQKSECIQLVFIGHPWAWCAHLWTAWTAGTGRLSYPLHLGGACHG